MIHVGTIKAAGRFERVARNRAVVRLSRGAGYEKVQIRGSGNDRAPPKTPPGLGRGARRRAERRQPLAPGPCRRMVF